MSQKSPLFFESWDDLVSTLFSREPQPPRSIQLEFTNDADSHAIFQTLGRLLTHGIVYLYGHDSDRNEIDVHKIQQYMASIGWHVVINPTHPSDYPRALPWSLTLPTYQVQVIFEPL